MRKIRVGSRESMLAVVQSEMVINYIRENCPDLEPELVTMKTTGDMILDRTLDKVGGKGLFVKELDQALMDGRSDLSVHSLKDMPAEIPEELPLIGFSKREDPRDALILPEGQSEIDFDKPIGCSGNRRILQLKQIFPQACFEPIRGNVQTRLRKLDEGQYSATVLAVAGLKRLGMEHRISRIFEPDEMIPAAGQGVLTLQGRADMEYTFLEGFCDETARLTSLAERAYIRELDGGCSSPIAAYATVEGDEIHLTGLYYDEDTQESLVGELSGSTADPEKLGCLLADKLREKAKKER